MTTADGVREAVLRACKETLVEYQNSEEVVEAIGFVWRRFVALTHNPILVGLEESENA